MTKSLKPLLEKIDDLKLISSIYQKLHKRNPNFTSSDILNLLKLEPQLMDISKRFV